MSYRQAIYFVTLEEILGGQQGMNWVIYNPSLMKTDNERIMKNVTKRVFRIDLTDDEVDELTIYDKFHLYEFIDAYKDMLNRHWEHKVV